MVTVSCGRQTECPAGAYSLSRAKRFLKIVKQSFWVALLALVVAGCGTSGLPTAKLEGTVTLDGTPIATGGIQFRPKDPKGQAPPAGAVISDGKYSAKGVPIGKVVVMVTATKETGKTITQGSDSRPEAVNIIPQKYQKGIEIDVTGDNPNQNFELKSK
jgi:hypothetical protein